MYIVVTAVYYAEAETSWFGICTTFDLVVQGESLGSVKEQLVDAIETYLDYASSQPHQEFIRLINRRAPLSLRLKLRGLVMLSSLVRLLGRESRYHHPFFRSTLPLERPS